MSMRNIVSIQEMQKVGDWARTYTWSLIFKKRDGSKVPDPPSMFKDWFPATDVTLNVSGVDTMDFVGGTRPFSIPKMMADTTLSVTMLDIYTLDVSRWFTKWMKAVVNVETGCVLPVKDAAYNCVIALFDSTENNVFLGEYNVIPSCSVSITRNSESQIVEHQADFKVVGIIRDLFDYDGEKTQTAAWEVKGPGQPRGVIDKE